MDRNGLHQGVNTLAALAGIVLSSWSLYLNHQQHTENLSLLWGAPLRDDADTRLWGPKDANLESDLAYREASKVLGAPHAIWPVVADVFVSNRSDSPASVISAWTDYGTYKGQGPFILKIPGAYKAYSLPLNVPARSTSELRIPYALGLLITENDYARCRMKRGLDAITMCLDPIAVRRDTIFLPKQAMFGPATFGVRTAEGKVTMTPLVRSYELKRPEAAKSGSKLSYRAH